MIISWYNEEQYYRQCEITSMDDIECYPDGELYAIHIRDRTLFGGILGRFKVEANRDAAWLDIKEKLDNGADEFEFRKNFYEKIS